MTIKDRSDRPRTDAVRLRVFILENIFYDEEAGALYMRGTPRLRIPVEAGSQHGRKPRVRIMGQPVLASHVAFILKTEQWPALPVRHLNGDESDIRWTNLELTRALSEEEEEEALIAAANNRFLADLRRYHPAGPPTYQIKSSGKPVVFHPHKWAHNGYGGGPSAMLADF